MIGALCHYFAITSPLDWLFRLWLIRLLSLSPPLSCHHHPDIGVPSKRRRYATIMVSLEFLVRPHGVFIGGYLSAPLAVVKVLKKLNLRCVQAAMAFTGGPGERKGPDCRRGSGNRRNASKFRKRAASACLTSPGVRVVGGRQPPT